MKNKTGRLFTLGALLVLILWGMGSTALASGESFPEEMYIARIESGGEELLFAKHSSSTADGNWIELSGGKSVRIPELSFSYNGVNHLKYGGSDLYLNVENFSGYTLSYPYSTHKIYTVSEKVYLGFKGNSTFRNRTVDVYLAKASSGSVENGIEYLANGEIAGCNAFFDNITDSHAKVASVSLDENGDFSGLDLGNPGAGLHGVVLLLNGTEKIEVLSATAIEVLDCNVSVSAPESQEEGKDLKISMDLEESAETGEYTYGALLIKESAYKADIRVESNGTRQGTLVRVNGIDLVDRFGLNSSNYRSRINRNELQENIPVLIGNGNGSIAIGNQNTLILITEGLPAGKYVLLSGVYQPGKGLLAFDQKGLEILKEKPGSGGSSGGGSGGSGGGGGGGGGSPEPPSNVRARERSWQHIANGNHAKFPFPLRVTCIDYIEFDPLRNLGKVTATVEMLKGKSVLVPLPPEGEIYESLNIWVGNAGVASPETIENSFIGFRVSKTWVTENNIDISSITLQRFSEGKWSPLPTRKAGEDSEYLYFEAQTPGFSPFAITARHITLEPVPGPESSQGTEAQEKPGISTPYAPPGEAGPDQAGSSKALWMKRLSNILSFIFGFTLLVGTWALFRKLNEDEEE